VCHRVNWSWEMLAGGSGGKKKERPRMVWGRSVFLVC